MLCCVCRQKNIKYADLDLLDLPGDATATVGDSVPAEKAVLAGRATPDDITDYHEIDWVKTQALTDTRMKLETDRKLSEDSLNG